MIVKLLSEHHLEFLSIKGGYRGSSVSTHVKMPHCWKSHALAQVIVWCVRLYRKIIHDLIAVEKYYNFRIAPACICTLYIA